jgi:hypothetical protein
MFRFYKSVSGLVIIAIGFTIVLLQRHITNTFKTGSLEWRPFVFPQFLFHYHIYREENVFGTDINFQPVHPVCSMESLTTWASHESRNFRIPYWSSGHFLPPLHGYGEPQRRCNGAPAARGATVNNCQPVAATGAWRGLHSLDAITLLSTSLSL